MGRPNTGPIPAISPNPEISTPLIVAEWSRALQAADLLHRYPLIPDFLLYSTNAGIPRLVSTFAPPNHPSIAIHKDNFLEIVDNEFSKGRYWGLYSKADIECIMGPFQTSPLSLIPKPGKPGKFRLIQNLSHPLCVEEVHSINSTIATDLYPCTWGTFATVAMTIWSLPPGSLGACRDVSEAYGIIPLARDQWLGVVVRLQGDEQAKPFAINTCVCFGKKSSGGLFGMFGDAMLDILREAGIGPSLRWVDDFIFFSIRKEHLVKYNKLRNVWKDNIQANGGRLQRGGRFWYKGGNLPSDHIEEFAEDMAKPLKSLPASRKDPLSS